MVEEPQQHDNPAHNIVNSEIINPKTCNTIREVYRLIIIEKNIRKYSSRVFFAILLLFPIGGHFCTGKSSKKSADNSYFCPILVYRKLYLHYSINIIPLQIN